MRPRVYACALLGLLAALPVILGGCAAQQTQETPQHVRIHDIQGPGHISPMRGLTVADVPGVVTAVNAQGFWMQDLHPDDKTDTSEAIYVYLADHPDVVPTDTVAVSGAVAEVRAGGDNSDGLTLTQIVRPKVEKTGRAALPPPIYLDQGGAKVPDKIYASAGNKPVDIERTRQFDHGRNAVDAFETLEGMRVAISNAVAVGSMPGELAVWPNGPVPEQVRTRTGSLLGSSDRSLTGRVILDSGIAPLPKANPGDTLPGTISGIWHYSGGNYTLLPTATPKVRRVDRQPETVPAASRELSIASLDVDDLSSTDSDATDRIGKLTEIIAKNLRAPDILVVTGVGDDSGKRDDNTVSGNSTFTALTTAVSSATHVHYDFRQIDPANDKDDATPGRNARSGFLFRSDNARFIDRSPGKADDSSDVRVNQGRAELTHSPGRISPGDDAFKQAPKALAGEFDIHGAPLFVVAADLAAGQLTAPRFGRFQPPRDPNHDERTSQADEIQRFVKRLSDASKTSQVIVTGNMGEDAGLDATTALTKDGVLQAAADTLPQSDRYNCNIDGIAALEGQTFHTPSTGTAYYDIVHTSADFGGVIDNDPQLLRIQASR